MICSSAISTEGVRGIRDETFFIFRLFSWTKAKKGTISSVICLYSLQ